MRFQPEFFTLLISTSPNGALQFVERFDVVKINTDSDFELKRLVCFFTPDGGPQTESTRRIPNLNFNIRDDATGRLLLSGFANTGALFGDGRVPFVLPTSHFFQRGGMAQVLYDVIDPGPDFGVGSIWLGLIGVKHFLRGLT